MSMFKKSFIVSTITLIIATLFFVFCGDEGTPDYCSDGHPYNSHTHFCWNDGQAYPICDGISNYDPTEKFCEDNKLWNRCNGERYLTSLQFCTSDGFLLFRCSGREFDPAVEGCIHNQFLWPRCGRNFYDVATEFCYNNRAVYQKCFNNPNFDYETFNPLYGCNGDPMLPTCDGMSYDPELMFCFYNEDTGDFETRGLCGGEDFDANIHDCVGGALQPKGSGNSDNIDSGYLVTIVSEGTGATGGGNYTAGSMVTIFAGTPPTGQQFRDWTTTNANVALIGDTHSTASFAMPSNDVTVVANFEEQNLCGDGEYNSETHFCDERDSKVYRFVEIGTQVWMAENLSFATAEGSWCNGSDTDNCNGYGRHYDWATAMYWLNCSSGDYCYQICPVGWHLPTEAEWSMLLDFVGGESTAGTKLKSTTGWASFQDVPAGTDEFGFSALPANGYGGITVSVLSVYTATGGLPRNSNTAIRSRDCLS